MPGFRIRSVLPCLLSAILVACGNMSQVRDSDRDTTGAYDGQWIGTFLKTPTRQQGPGNWVMSCNDREGAIVVVGVNDGKIATFNEDGEVRSSTNISASGNFRMVIPTEFKAEAGGRSDVPIGNGAVTFVLTGKLGKKQPSGRFMVGIRELGNQGCITKIKFKRATGTEQAS